MIDFNDIDYIDYIECIDYPDFEGHEDFCRFLVDNGALDKFIDNYDVPEHSNINKFLMYSQPIDYLISAFHWMGSKEGYDFWYKLNNEWVGSLRK
jgi:hypothetical protein